MPEVSALLVPRFNVNDDQAIIVAWLVPSGTRVAAEQRIALLETSKATFDVHADRAGYLTYEHEVKSIVPVGAVLAHISDEPILAAGTQPRSGAPAAAPDAVAAAAAGVNPASAALRERVSRKALRRMRELGVSPEELPGSGRIEVADVERIAANRGQRQSAAANEYWQPLKQSTAKLMEAARLGAVYRSIVPSMVTMPLSCEPLGAKLRARAEGIGPVSLLELTIREAAALLGEFPDLNGFFADGRAWTYRDVAIGFAVNAAGDLKVPVVHGAARLSQLEVCRAVRDLTLRCFRGDLPMNAVSGGTFTLTDLSGAGVTHFVPVLNERQSAILGICAAEPGAGHQNLVLAFDHRMSNGLRGGEFLGALIDRLEGGA